MEDCAGGELTTDVEQKDSNGFGNHPIKNIQDARVSQGGCAIAK
jgi:hypothetical protein